MAQRIAVEPNMLTWAIERAGFTVEEMLAKKPMVGKWLAGEREPTFKQLQDFAKRVYLPFGYLFLPEPPTEKLTIPYFRTEQGLVDSVSINVFDTIRLLKRRQDWLVDYLRENEFARLSFVGSHTERSEPEVILHDLRTVLGLATDWAAPLRNWEEALLMLSKAIEATGVVVVYNSVVGNNNHRRIEVSECRGFVLVDPYAPFIFINSRDAKAAQMFTLIHEFVHILLGQSAGSDLAGLQPAPAELERLCDYVAAEFLVPAALLKKQWETERKFGQLARIFKVSQIVIARRALDLGLVDREQFFAFYRQRQAAYRNRKEQEEESGGHYFYTTRKRLSALFAGHVNDALNSGQLLHSEAYRLTGLSGNNFERLTTEYLGRE